MPGRPTRPRWPAGPRYDLLEVAIVLGSGALLLYVAQSANSSAESWLTAPGQRIAGCLMLGSCTAAALCAGYRRTVRTATLLLVVMGAFWPLVLTLGLCFGGFRPGSLFVAIVFGFCAQWARKAYDRHRDEVALTADGRP